jgi:hypothetical protein
MLFSFLKRDARREHIPWKSVTDEQRSISASQPEDDGKCTLKTRPNALTEIQISSENTLGLQG